MLLYFRNVAFRRRHYMYDKDREYLRKIRKEYKNLVRNVWNPFDKNHENLGCTTVNRLCNLLVMLVCPYVHIKIGIYLNNL